MSTLTGLALVAQALITFGPAFLACTANDDPDLAAIRRARRTNRALARATRRQ